MNSTERETIHGAKSAIFNNLTQPTNEVNKVIAILYLLGEEQRKKVVKELQDLDLKIITKLFDGLDIEDLKNAVQIMPDLFNKEYLANENFDLFSNKGKINQELLDKLKCLPNFDVGSFAEEFLKSQKFNGGEEYRSLEDYIKNTENNKIKEEEAQRTLEEAQRKLEEAHVAVYFNIILDGSVKDLKEILERHNINLNSCVYELDKDWKETKIKLGDVIKNRLETASQDEKPILIEKQQLLGLLDKEKALKKYFANLQKESKDLSYEKKQELFLNNIFCNQTVLDTLSTIYKNKPDNSVFKDLGLILSTTFDDRFMFQLCSCGNENVAGQILNYAFNECVSNDELDSLNPALLPLAALFDTGHCGISRKYDTKNFYNLNLTKKQISDFRTKYKSNVTDFIIKNIITKLSSESILKLNIKKCKENAGDNLYNPDLKFAHHLLKHYQTEGKITEEHKEMFQDKFGNDIDFFIKNNKIVDFADFVKLVQKSKKENANLNASSEDQSNNSLIDPNQIDISFSSFKEQESQPLLNQGNKGSEESKIISNSQPLSNQGNKRSEESKIISNSQPLLNKGNKESKEKNEGKNCIIF